MATGAGPVESSPVSEDSHISSEPAAGHPSPERVDRAIRLSYAQMMLAAVFTASTGGMFLIGFAMSLGADNVLLGLMTTVPACFVVVQFLAARLIQRGFSRKMMTVIFSFIGPLCWLLIASIPLLGDSLGRAGRLAVLIAVMIVVTIAGQFAGNAPGQLAGRVDPSQAAWSILRLLHDVREHHRGGLRRHRGAIPGLRDPRAGCSRSRRCSSSAAFSAWLRRR